MNARQIATHAGPVALVAVGLIAAAWCVTRPVPFWPGVLFGAVLIVNGWLELRFRFKARQIARKRERRGGYVV